VAPDSVAIALVRRFTEAVNQREHGEAARLLAGDVVVTTPGGALHGRDEWLESRGQQAAPGDLAEEVLVDEITEAGNRADLRGRLVQRWAETREIADEMPVRIGFTIDDGGLISRLELRPG
jgi:hypothetical protein